MLLEYKQIQIQILQIKGVIMNQESVHVWLTIYSTFLWKSLYMYTVLTSYIIFSPVTKI